MRSLTNLAALRGCHPFLVTVVVCASYRWIGRNHKRNPRVEILSGVKSPDAVAKAAQRAPYVDERYHLDGKAVDLALWLNGVRERQFTRYDEFDEDMRHFAKRLGFETECGLDQLHVSIGHWQIELFD